MKIVIVKVFSVYDCKAEAYMMPQYYHTSGVAERAFKQAVNSEDTQFYTNPQDFTLFELGTFDDSRAEFFIYNTPISVVTALQVKKSVS